MKFALNLCGQLHQHQGEVGGGLSLAYQRDIKLIERLGMCLHRSAETLPAVDVSKQQRHKLLDFCLVALAQSGKGICHTDIGGKQSRQLAAENGRVQARLADELKTRWQSVVLARWCRLMQLRECL